MSGIIKLSSPATGQFWKIPILFQDEHLLVLDKPAQLASTAPPQHTELPDFTGLLQAAIREKKSWAAELGLQYLAPAHRLDEEVSGALMFACQKTVHQGLVNQFHSEKPLLEITALVQRTPLEEQFEINAALAPNPRREDCMRVLPAKGKRSRTTFQVEEKFRGYTFMRCFPLTHRRHQVRVHIKEAGLRLCGDTTYRGRKLMLSSLKPNYRLKPDKVERPLLGLPALHARAICIDHPVTGQPLRIESPTPKDLQVALKYLRQYCPL